MLDLVVHLGLGAGAAFAEYEATTGTGRVPTAVVTGLVVLVGVSIVDRVFIQAITGTTSGKALVGICTIRDDTGQWPPFWKLVKQWFGGAIKIILEVIST